MMNIFNNGDVIYTVEDIARMEAELERLRADNAALKAALKAALLKEKKKQWYEGDYLKESQLAKGK